MSYIAGMGWTEIWNELTSRKGSGKLGRSEKNGY